MTVPVWPAELPRPERSSLQISQVDPRLKRETDIPVPGYRRRFSGVPREVSLSITVPRYLRAVFDKFHKETTKAGSLPFWMPDPTTDGWGVLNAETGQVLIAGGPNDGEPLLIAARWLCLFGDQPPVVTLKALRFRIAFSVTVMP